MNEARPPARTSPPTWNGASGHAWVELQPVLDDLFRSLEELLVAEAVAAAPQHVLDVGCGVGSTTLALAHAQSGRVTGVDISEPMLVAARARDAATRATFVLADAQTHSFPPATYDLLVSRFGVMFFDDPVAAFTNLHRAATATARLCCLVWRAAAENPFMTTAERASAPHLSLPVRKPDGPGQFAFADEARVRSILGKSGWHDVALERVDATCTMPEAELVRYFTLLGPVGQALAGVDAATRARVTETVREAFEPYVHDAQVRFDAACWLVRATA